MATSSDQVGPNRARRVSTFCSVTFHGQSKLIFNTNATGHTRGKVLGLLTSILGPFRETEVEVGSLAVVMIHKGEPFGSVRNLMERESVSVQLCVLFQEMYKLGWKAVGSAVFDPVKRRGNVVFKLHGHPVSTQFACFAVQHSHDPHLALRPLLATVVPEEFELRIYATLCHRLSRRSGGSTPVRLGQPYSKRREFKARRDDENKLIAQAYELDKYERAFTVETAPSSVGPVLQVINALHSLEFHLEASVNVFGPGSQSILIFGHRTKEDSLPEEPVWAMTVMNPKKVVLVDAPQEVWHLVKGETDGWRQFGAGDFWGRREDFSLGKMSYIKLLTRLAIDNWTMLSSYDGLYKNSFVFFRKSDAPYLFLESNPKIVSFSSVSDKKLKFDDILVASVSHGQSIYNQQGSSAEASRCLNTIDHTFLRPKRCYDNDKIRVFDNCQFAYYNTTTIAKQMCIYMVLMMELEMLGYSLYGAANISGRYNIDSDTRGVSPHTWFFIRLPESLYHLSSAHQPSAPTYDGAHGGVSSGAAAANVDDDNDDGLPTYEEAMAMVEKEDAEEGKTTAAATGGGGDNS